MAAEDDLFASFMSEIETVEKEAKAETQPNETERSALVRESQNVAAGKLLPARDNTGHAPLSKVMGGDDDDADELYLAEASRKLLSTHILGVRCTREIPLCSERSAGQRNLRASQVCAARCLKEQAPQLSEPCTQRCT